MIEKKVSDNADSGVDCFRALLPSIPNFISHLRVQSRVGVFYIHATVI